MTTPFGAIRAPEWLGRVGDRSLIFHARGKLAASLVAGKFRLLGAFAAHAAGQGWQVEVVEYSDLSHPAATDGGGHLHILMEDRPLYGPGVFHAVPSYLRGYWYFDEVATRNNSSLRLANFDQRHVAQGYADRFVARLHGQFAAKNFSKFQQAVPGSEPVAKGCLAFFAQDFKPPRFHVHHMTVPQMIDAAIAAKGARALYIKPHPNNTAAELATLTGYHDPVAGVFVTWASIHDLLAACDCVLTLTSAVAFEGFMHRKPAVLGGQTDFHHNAITLTNPTQMAAAIDMALAKPWPHARYLVWFLRQQLFEDHEKSLPHLLARVHQKGFDFSAAGNFGA